MACAWVFDEVIDKELCRAFHEGVGSVAQKVSVAGVFIMPPQVLAQPGTTRGPNAVIAGVDGRGATPNIGVVVEYPAATAVVRSCGFLPAFGDFFEHAKEGFMAGG